MKQLNDSENSNPDPIVNSRKDTTPNYDPNKKIDANWNEGYKKDGCR